MIRDVNRKRLVGMLLLSTLTGIMAGLVGGMFHLLVQKMFDLRSAQLHFLPYAESLGWLYSMLITTGLVLFAVFLVRRFSAESAGSGVQEIEGTLEDQRSIHWHKVLPVKFFGGLSALSSGMELGREGPTIQMGGTLGKMLSDFFHLQDEDLKILISAGAGAGLTTAFNAPLAGVLFVIEEMRKQFAYNYLSVASVVTACVSSNIVLIALVGDVIDVPLPHLQAPDLALLWLFVLLGAAFGVLGVLFNRYLVVILDWFAMQGARLYYLQVTLFAAALGLLIWFVPYLGGGAHLAIEQAFALEGSASFLLALLLMRFALSLLSYGVGAPGGIFSPMIAMGVIGGLLFAELINLVPLDMAYSKEMFAVAGMGALFAATVRAPLTGIILVVEITRSYELILPLILTTLVATIVSAELGGKPIYSVLLQRTLDIQKFGKDGYFKRKKLNAPS